MRPGLRLWIMLLFVLGGFLLMGVVLGISAAPARRQAAPPAPALPVPPDEAPDRREEVTRTQVLGVPVVGYVAPAGDADWYRFEFTATMRVRVRLADLPADYDLYVFDGDGQFRGASTWWRLLPEEVVVRVPAGVYYVQLVGYAGAWNGATPYELLVAPARPGALRGLRPAPPRDATVAAIQPYFAIPLPAAPAGYDLVDMVLAWGPGGTPRATLVYQRVGGAAIVTLTVRAAQDEPGPAPTGTPAERVEVAGRAALWVSAAAGGWVVWQEEGWQLGLSSATLAQAELLEIAAQLIIR